MWMDMLVVAVVLIAFAAVVIGLVLRKGRPRGCASGCAHCVQGQEDCARAKPRRR